MFKSEMKQHERHLVTRLLKFSEACDNLYNLGNRNRLSALRWRSNRPIANGVAAVNILYKHITLTHKQSLCVETNTGFFINIHSTALSQHANIQNNYISHTINLNIYNYESQYVFVLQLTSMKHCVALSALSLLKIYSMLFTSYVQSLIVANDVCFVRHNIACIPFL